MALKNIILTHTYKKEVAPFLDSLDKEKYGVSTTIRENPSNKHIVSGWSHETHSKIRMKHLLQESEMDDLMNKLLEEQNNSIMLKNIKFYTSTSDTVDMINWISSSGNPEKYFSIKHCTDCLDSDDKKNKVYRELIDRPYDFHRLATPANIFTMKVSIDDKASSNDIRNLYRKVKDVLYLPITSTNEA